MFIKQTLGNTGKYQEIWEIPGNMGNTGKYKISNNELLVGPAVDVLCMMVREEHPGFNLPI